MTIELGRRLLSSGAASAADVNAALFAHLTTGPHFLHALVLRGAIDEAVIDREVALAGVPTLTKVVPNLDLVARLPRGLCASLLAVPIRVDPFTGTVDLAVADPFDAHVVAEFAFHLNARIRPLYARLSLVDQALDEIELALGQDERVSQPFALGSAIGRAKTPAFGSVAAAIALQAARRSSDMPIPLVRRSHAPHAPVPEPPDKPSRRGRITRDAIVLDPAAMAAETRSAPSQDVDPVIPLMPSPPSFDSPPQSLPFDLARLDDALTALEHAVSRDAVVAALIQGMMICAGRVAIFAVRKEAFSGWACSQYVASASPFRDVAIPRDPPSALSEAASRGWFLGPLSNSPADQLLSALLHPPSDEVAVFAVKLSGRPAAMIVADQLSDTLIATRTADRLARSAAAALLRIVRADKVQGR